jgi:hypothetical protein
MKELFNKLNSLSPISIIFTSEKELNDHLEALSKINNPANLTALDLLIFQEMISIIKKENN